MTLPAWREAAIAKTHDRKAFDCAVAELNQYLLRFARQNHEAGLSKTFVAESVADPSHILGYYSVSAAQLECDDVPDTALRRVGHYPVPVILLDRLAMDVRYHGLGLGGQLLLSAGERALQVSQHVGIRALAIEAKSEQIAAWYERFGAARLKHKPLSLVLPLDTVEMALKRRGKDEQEI